MPSRPHRKHRERESKTLSRRHFLERALSTGGMLGLFAPARLLAQQALPEATTAAPGLALQLARRLNAVTFDALPPLAVEHAKMIVASTLSSAALGSDFESTVIVRDLSKEHAGKAESLIWFDGMRLPAHEAARVNAMQSDAAASDDSDIRNTAHYGTA